jgi:lysophospholipase L1-like esterase
MGKQPSGRPVRFVAVGDSFTEGVGDRDLRLPNGCRGWADRVAEELARYDGRTLYANLALRGRRLGTIVDEQLDAALAMEPTVVSFYAGGNDLLMARLDMRSLMATYERAVERIVRTGARALLFTAYNVPLSPVLEPLKLRIAAYNRQVRRIARATVPRWWTTGALRHTRTGASGLRTGCTCPGQATSTWPPKSWRCCACRVR